MKKYLYIILALVVLAFPAAAQNAVLNAQQLGNLVVGLKGALKENLTPIANGQASYTAITQRWDARRDLSGKSKKQVIDLLYTDVEAVIKSPAIRYQVNQVFALYDRMPDSQFSAKTSFKDPRDGELYGIKKLGNRTWMNENLRYDMGNDSICYDDDGENCAELGMLYTFNGAMKACPTGWRLPSDSDWMDLENALGMPQNQLMIDGYSTTRGYREGLMLQVGGTSELNFKISGFATSDAEGYSFDGRGNDRPRSYFWTSTAKNINGQRNVYRRRIEANSGMVYRFANPAEGYLVSVRCVQ
ncbi:MAG TPA: FISUMP domain-containing protein [Pyrinomonadaceae bacterium]|nr:FISUMP domain-containing protein [Pyrinomonadaceae bacterium]